MVLFQKPKRSWCFILWMYDNIQYTSLYFILWWKRISQRENKSILYWQRSSLFCHWRNKYGLVLFQVITVSVEVGSIFQTWKSYYFKQHCSCLLCSKRSTSVVFVVRSVVIEFQPEASVFCTDPLLTQQTFSFLGNTSQKMSVILFLYKHYSFSRALIRCSSFS